MVREGRVLISSVGDPDFGASYYVTAYEVGAQVTSGSSETTVTVRAGHGFAANDKFIIGTSTTIYRTVTAVTATTLTIGEEASVSAGDLLVNLGADSGTTAPAYNSPGLTVYTDMDYSSSATDNTVTTDANGRYRYYHRGIAIWELVRSSLAVPFALYTDGYELSAQSIVNVQSFGARGDGTTNDAAAIQAAINYVSATVGTGTGGEVYFPSGNYIIKSTISLKQFVKLRGVNFSGIDDVYSANNAATITAAATFTGTAMFSTIASSEWWGVELNSLRLNANALVANGIVLDGTKEARLYDLVIQDTTASAVWLVRPGAGIGLETRMFNVQCQRCNTSTAASRRGVIHIEQTDCFIQNCRARGNNNTAYTNSGNLCGFYVSGTGNFFSDSYADFNEDGWVVAAYGNQFVNCRADTNGGHGWVITSAVNSGTAVGCYAANNGQVTTNTYDGFNCAASRFVFAGCQVVFNGVTNTHRYAYNQTSAFGADNRWVGCNAIPAAYGTALFGDTNAAGGWEFQNAYLVQAADDATPTVLNVRTLSTGSNNTTPTAVTALDNGVANQCVRVVCFNNTNYSYIANGGNFTLSAGDWYPKNGEWIDLHTFNGTLWYEVARSAKSFGTISLIDGIAAVGTTSGRVHIYVDTADGDLKIRFGDGSIVTIQDVAGTVLTLASTPTVTTNWIFGDADTDTYTHVGRMIVRTVSVDPSGSATAGTIGEVVYSSSTAKFYGKHTATATDTNWRLMGT